jgi:chromosome segregation ATPase
MFNKRLAGSKSASQLLADLRVSNERMSGHLEDELALEMKLTVEVDKVRQRISLAKKQIEDYKVKELRVNTERRELEEDYYRQLDEVKKLSQEISVLQNDLKTGKRMYNDVSLSLERARKHYLRTEAELRVAHCDLDTIQQEALANAQRPINTQTQTDVDISTIKDLDVILSDCQEQRRTINRIRASLTSLTQGHA